MLVGLGFTKIHIFAAHFFNINNYKLCQETEHTQ
jgi:hypothetical protein